MALEKHNSQNRPSLPKPFDLRWIAATEMELIIGEDFSERGWAAWFGEVQQALEKRRWSNRVVDACHVDLSSCEWADPLPLLSLTLELARFEDAGNRVSITLPEEYKEDSRADPGCLERTRLLKFLAREGFLELLVQHKPFSPPSKWLTDNFSLRTTWLGPDKFVPDDFEKLREFRAPLAFEESTCLPAKLFSFAHHGHRAETTILEDIDRWVEHALDVQISPVVADKVPGWAQRGLQYRLKMFLRETLHNIAEHAYDDAGLAGVYVRYREGRMGQAPSAWKMLEKHIKREEDIRYMALLGNIPRHHSFARVRTGFFEVHILDAGAGLVRRIAESKSMRYLHMSNNPLHETMRAIFHNGYSSKKDRPTEFGGLYLVQQLLEPAKDYLRSRDEDTWWGKELPLPTTQSDTTPSGHFTVACEASSNRVVPIRGLAWTARLSWLDRMDTDVPDWRGMTKREHRAPLLDRLRDGHEDTSLLDDLPVYDWRLSGKNWSNVQAFKNKPSSSVMILPARDWMKNSIQDRLNHVLASGCLVPGGTLLVGEIPSDEALTYLAAIRRAERLFTPLPHRPRRIILVTRDLRTCVLVKPDTNGLYVEQGEQTRLFVEGNYNPGQHRFTRLVDYHRIIRLHDARRLWQTVGVNIENESTAHDVMSFKDSHDTPGPFVNAWVDWHKQLCLDGYLDFPGTLSIPVCRGIYGLCLERLTALFPERDCKLIPLDSLVESLIVRFRAQQRPRTGSPSRRISNPPVEVQVGSVQVSGLTERINRDSRETPTIFHFFRHPSGNAKGFYLLPWLAPERDVPPSDCSEPEKRARGFYERVGRTSAIAKDGWKAYLMPRFDEDEKPIYENSPKDSYRTWQDASRSPMKIGHWSYGGHHDLLSINLLLAFDTELDKISLAFGGALGRYIYANLFRVFDIREEHLCKAGQSLFRAIDQDRFHKLLPESLAHNNTLLIFPSHPVTDHVIDRFLALVDNQEKFKDIYSRCIPILPLRRHRGGSGLQISGLMLERLTALRSKQQDKAPPVVFFDDAMISGRTYSEIKSLLHSIGFRDIYSLVMLDRQRLPSAYHVNRSTDGGNETKNACYWRLDAPALGSQGHCPLCRGLGRAMDLSQHLHNRENRARVHSWQKHWTERNPATEWGDGGLRPIPLDLQKAERKFGIVEDKNDETRYRQAGGDDQMIRLTNSAGVVAWITELHSITSRDDLPLRLLHTETLSPEIKIQILSTQLLLFFGEFDTELAVDLGYELAVALHDTRKHDRNTALAGLTLVACGNRFLKDVMARLVRKFEREENDEPPVATRVRETNLDFRVLLEICSVLEIDIGRLKPRRYSDSVEHVGKDSGTSPENRLDLYRRLYREVLAGQSESHSAYLSRFAKLPEESNADNQVYFDRAKDSATKLCEIVSRLDSIWLRNDPGYKEGYKDDFRARSKEIGELAEVLEKEIAQAERAYKDDPTQSIDLRKCRETAKTLLNSGSQVFQGAFTPLGIQKMKEGEESALLHKIENEIQGVAKRDRTIACAKLLGRKNKKAVEKLGKPDMEEVYVVWDTDVLQALDEILSNVKHAESEFKCPDEWDYETKEVAHLWIGLRIENRHIALVLQQASTRHAEEVEKEMKGKLCLRVFSSLGGFVTFETVGRFLQTTIRIPYAHTLGDSHAEVS